MGPDATAQSDNPFATPQSDDAPRPAPLADLGGRMPGSVKLAVSCIALFTLLAGYHCVQFWWEGARLWEIAVLAGVPAFFGAGIANGLLRRNRYARLWGRVLTSAGAALVTLWVAAFAYAMWKGGYFRDTTLRPFAFGLLIPESLRVALMAVYLGIQAVSLGIAYVALGRESAKRYFDPIPESVEALSDRFRRERGPRAD